MCSWWQGFNLSLCKFPHLKGSGKGAYPTEFLWASNKIMYGEALAQCLALSRDLGKPSFSYNIIFILQTIYSLTPGVKMKKTLSSLKMSLRSLFFFYFIFKLHIIVLVLPNIKMNPPQVYTCSPSWTLLPPHTIPLGRSSAPALKISNLSKNWLIMLRNCFASLWIFLGCTMGTTNVKQKMKEIKGVGENVKARKDQAFLGLPQRRAECDQTVFCIHKGVKAFTFCKGKNLLLTGGMDRIIRIWNPHLPG